MSAIRPPPAARIPAVMNHQDGGGGAHDSRYAVLPMDDRDVEMSEMILHPHPHSHVPSPSPHAPPSHKLVSEQNRSTREVLLNFTFAGLSCMTGALFTNPFDIVKVRQQLSPTLRSPPFYALVKDMLRTEGARGFMKGVSASLSREATYSTIRFGAYDFFKGWLHGVSGGRLDERGFGNKVMSGLASGCIGASLANPTDLLKVRLQAPSTPHTHLLPTLSFLLRERGVLGLYRACLPTTIRAALLTSSQLASYDHTKHFLMEWGGMREGFGLHFASSAVAGGVCSFVSAPVDVIKVRIMNAPPTTPGVVSVSVSQPSPLGALAANVQTPGNILKQAHATGAGAPPGVIGTTMKIYQEEGLRAFFRGGFMCWMRLWPHTVISLMVFEQLRRWAGIEPI